MLLIYSWMCGFSPEEDDFILNENWNTFPQQLAIAISALTRDDSVPIFSCYPGIFVCLKHHRPCACCHNHDESTWTTLLCPENTVSLRSFTIYVSSTLSALSSEVMSDPWEDRMWSIYSPSGWEFHTFLFSAPCLIVHAVLVTISSKEKLLWW